MIMKHRGTAPLADAIAAAFSEPSDSPGAVISNIRNCTVKKEAPSMGHLSLWHFWSREFHRHPEELCVENKFHFFKWCQKQGIRTPHCFEAPAEGVEEYVVKPAMGCHGKGVRLEKSPNFNDRSFVIQERLRNSKAVQEITKMPNVLCCWRVQTNSSKLKMPTVTGLRIPTNDDSIVDNTNQGAAIHITDPTTGNIFYTTKSGPILRPDRNKIIGKIAGMDKLVDQCEKLHHEFFDMLPLLGWDVTFVNDDCFCIVEVNLYPSPGGMDGSQDAFVTAVNEFMFEGMARPIRAC